MNKKRILIAGGGGFIGAHTARILGERNPKSLFVVRSKDYDLTNEDHVVRLFSEHPSTPLGQDRSAHARKSRASCWSAGIMKGTTIGDFVV